MKKQSQERAILATRREMMIAVVAAYPGGRECVAARLGLTLKRLDNHLYGCSGASPLTDEQIRLLESETGTTYLPDYLSGLYGGVFVPMADPQELDNLVLYQRSAKTSMQKGAVDRIIHEALEDGVLEPHEVEQILEAHNLHISARHEEVHAVIQLHTAKKKVPVTAKAGE